MERSLVFAKKSAGSARTNLKNLVQSVRGAWRVLTRFALKYICAWQNEVSDDIARRLYKWSFVGKLRCEDRYCKMLKGLVVALFLVVPTDFPKAGVTILGAGSQTCSAWLNRKKNAVVKGSFESWVVGFISGLNVSGERDIVGGGDFDAVVSWMDKHCAATPSERIGIVALDLGMELASKASSPP